MHDYYSAYDEKSSLLKSEVKLIPENIIPKVLHKLYA